MKLLRMIVSLIMVLMLTACLCACGGGTNNSAETGNGISVTEPSESADNQSGTETEPSNVQADPINGYKVTLLDQDEDPVRNAWLKMRMEDGTILHAMTDSYGIAVFDAAEGRHTVSVVVTSDDYESSPEDSYTFSDGAKELTIHVFCTKIKA